MDRKNLIIAGSIIGAIIVLLCIGMLIFPNSASADDSISFNSILSTGEDLTDPTFDTSTPEKTAISIARLNEGQDGFKWWINANASLTPDRKYWIVNIYHEDYEANNSWVVTVDAQTWMSQKNGGESSEYTVAGRPKLLNTWRSFDELKAQYIAEIQMIGEDGSTSVGRPQKITMEGKEVWKVPIKVPVYKYSYTGYEIHTGKNKTEYVYVDVATGKSKSTLDEFNELAGTDGWLTLKEVDDTLTKMYGSESMPFRNVLRNLYPENSLTLHLPFQ